MTAQRPRKTGPLEEAALIEILFSGSPAGGSGWLVERRSRVWRPPTDVYETDDEFVVQVEIAGVRQEDFSISLYERRLTISGVRHNPGPDRRAYHQMEVQLGEFRTEVELPGPVVEAQIEAEYGAGFLHVILPKLRPQRLSVE
jgi:HSP20 family protein